MYVPPIFMMPGSTSHRTLVDQMVHFKELWEDEDMQDFLRYIGSSLAYPFVACASRVRQLKVHVARQLFAGAPTATLSSSTRTLAHAATADVAGAKEIGVSQHDVEMGSVEGGAGAAGADAEAESAPASESAVGANESAPTIGAGAIPSAEEAATIRVERI
jgi:hypothetical protein